MSEPRTIHTQPLVLPAVVACGYRRVQIPKSGNTFPALLVAFEADACKGKDGKSVSDTNIKNGGNGNYSKDVRFAWRSKKDFLLLARKGEKSLPKAAFKKVVDENTVPWRRSSRDTKNALEQIRQKNVIIPDCLCNDKLPNHYSVKMKKSIWQLDNFLRLMQSKARESEERQTAWDFFCRTSDTDDLDPIQESSINEQTKKDEATCSDPDTSISSTTALQESSRLGQYFASKENARKVVNYALEKIISIFHRDPNPSSRTKILFVEPSCGHGDIVVSLIEALEKYENICPHHEQIWIVGYDIDPSAIEACRKRKEFRPNARRKYKENKHETHIHKGGKDNDYTIFWECSNFLEASLEDCICRFDEFRNEKSERGDGPVKADEVLVCCLGGPPYTTGQGSGCAMKRDLPEKFVDHCYNEWKADVISFLLPARYREESKLPGESAFSATKPPRRSMDRDRSSTDDWVRETHELEASKFFFRGVTEVIQPSIIKLFYRSETGEGISSNGDRT